MSCRVMILLAIAGILTSASAASATLIENFDSYADQSAFQTAWPSWIADGTSMTLSRSLGYSGSQSVSGVALANYKYRNWRNLDDFTAYAGTDDSPVRFQVSLYDANPLQTGAGNARNFVELRAYGTGPAGDGMPALSSTTGYSLQSVIALGLYNSPNGNTYNFRVYGGGSNAWYSTQVKRTAGWHTMTAMIGSTSLQIYVDDVLTNTIALCTPIPAFDGVVLGSGLTSNGYDVAFDDLMVAKTPEPATLLVLAAGAVFLRRRRA
ncbi:MAG TPA: PEP-CTERM sorting domain-containing protein [Phycisphaerae bacterium]|nr:PEP-CTERM sorting domain-containing protein [Phycisphaerae bacterium]